MTDDEFIRQFEGCTFPFEQWHHRAHVKLAYLYLMRHGFEVVPVNPREHEVFGRLAYPDLAAAAEAANAAGRPIEVVDIFRRADLAGAHVDEAIAIGAKAVWLQLGVIDEAAAGRARGAGLLVVMDRCPAIELPRLGASDSA